MLDQHSKIPTTKAKGYNFFYPPLKGTETEAKDYPSYIKE